MSSKLTLKFAMLGEFLAQVMVSDPDNVGITYKHHDSFVVQVSVSDTGNHNDYDPGSVEEESNRKPNDPKDAGHKRAIAAKRSLPHGSTGCGKSDVGGENRPSAAALIS
jgi:hypothetical protein